MEEFKKKALEYLEGLEIFTKKEVPEFFRELLTYETITTSICLGMNLVILLTSIYGFYKGINIPKVESGWYGYEYPDHAVILIFLSGVFTLGTLIGSIASLCSLIKIKFAPRVFIVDYIKDLVKPESK